MSFLHLLERRSGIFWRIHVFSHLLKGGFFVAVVVRRSVIVGILFILAEIQRVVIKVIVVFRIAVRLNSVRRFMSGPTELQLPDGFGITAGDDIELLHLAEHTQRVELHSITPRVATRKRRVA